MRPFRFLATASEGIASAGQIVETAKRAESMGFSALVLPDHLVAQHAPIPVLATVAAVTERLRIGTFVFNNCLRHPAVLAQDLASLDVLSVGRLEIGIGAGWNRPEHDAIGLPFPSVGTRIDQLTEALAVLKGCFGDDRFTFDGKHYTITDHDAQPKPVQKPYPPVFIGGGGRRLLTLAAREADIVGLAPRLQPGDQTEPNLDARSITFAATAEKIAWVREAAGARFDDLELNTYPSGAPVIVTNDALAKATEVAGRLTARTGIEITPEEVLDSPHIYIGSVDQLTDKLLGLRERLGISSFMVGDIDELAPVVERLVGR